MSLISPFEIADHYAMHCWGRAECPVPDSRNAVVESGKSLAGMGAWYDSIPFTPSARETDPCAPSPSWCDSLGPFGYLAADCLPIDPAKCQGTTFGGSMTEENKALARQKGDESVAAYCKANPDMCSAYSTVALVTGRESEPGTKPVVNYTTLFLIGTAIFGVVLLAKR
jgi:hypothetical protein